MRYNKSLNKAKLIEFAKHSTLSTSELASKFGYSFHWTRQILREAGIRVSQNRVNSHQRVPRDEILKYAVENGLTLRELGDMLGVSRERARQLLTVYKLNHT